MEKIKEIIDLYYNKKYNNNDYVIELGKVVDSEILDIKSGETHKQKSNQVSTRFDLINNSNYILKNKNIKNLSPDKIDNKFFWSYITEKFPCYSISQYPECKNEDDVNKANLNSAIWTGFYQKINNKLKTNPHSKILEIGPGYGSLFYHILRQHTSCNYWAIDINKLFYYDGLIECDGQTIPKEIGGDFDLIFSFNVFNHLSKKQRSSYYKEAYEKLNHDGVFIFSNYLIAENNKEVDGLWPFKDEKGKRYTSFFSQLIEVDEYETLADELNDIGFSINVKLSQNFAIIECKK